MSKSNFAKWTEDKTNQEVLEKLKEVLIGMGHSFLDVIERTKALNADYLEEDVIKLKPQGILYQCGKNYAEVSVKQGEIPEFNIKVQTEEHGDESPDSYWKHSIAVSYEEGIITLKYKNDTYWRKSAAEIQFFDPKLGKDFWKKGAEGILIDSPQQIEALKEHVKKMEIYIKQQKSETVTQAISISDKLDKMIILVNESIATSEMLTRHYSELKESEFKLKRMRSFDDCFTGEQATLSRLKDLDKRVALSKTI